MRVLTDHRASFRITNGQMIGAGADTLARIARDNQFLMVGEDHGIAEVPQFVEALFRVAQPAGYSHLAVEIGPVTGRRVESMVRAHDAQASIDAFLGHYTAFTLPFFFWKEESQMLEHVVKLATRHDVVWGLDQEFMMSPTYLFERLAVLAPSPAARTFVTRLAASSAAGDRTLMTAGNPSSVWMVAARDSDVATLRALYRASPSREAHEIVDELSKSRDIYNSSSTGRNYESNQDRADLMKRHFVASYRAAIASGERAPRVIVKLGANHIFRGLSVTSSYEMGTFLPEFALAQGSNAYSILLVVAKGTTNAYRPFGSPESDKAKAYDLLTSDEYAVMDMKSVLSAASSDQLSFIDLRQARAMSLNGGLRRLSPQAKRLLLSFDAVVVVPEGHASTLFR